MIKKKSSKLSRKKRKRILRRKEIKLQKEIKDLMKDGMGNSNYFWIVKHKLNRIQWKFYKLSCKPVRI
jgi:hypothetical protein